MADLGVVLNSAIPLSHGEEFIELLQADQVTEVTFEDSPDLEIVMTTTRTTGSSGLAKMYHNP